MFKTGKVPPEILKSSVYPYTGKLRDEVLIHSSFGEDCSIIDFGEKVAVLSTDPITGADIQSSRLAVYVSCNDIAACGAAPLGILVTLLLPLGADESLLEELMNGIDEAAKRINVEILGGHSEITPTVSKSVISTTAIGITDKDKFVTSSGAKPGDAVIVTKALGLEGSAILASDFEDFLVRRLPKEIVARAKTFIEQISVVDEGIIASRAGVSAMHDITEGGLLGACCEVAEASGVGIEIQEELIPILPETKEICKVFDIDPLGLISSGSMLICTSRPDKVITELENAGIIATVIGRIIPEGKFMISSDKRNPIIPFERDELYKAIEKAKGFAEN
ncbi:hydrogenase [Tepidanaerobacter syntrophicus]|uniref:AIR synthase family protein n=1 Tax=Tepidanaerobacter syntrophicus TaxID=224999 RepID=UPI0022EE5AD6|nr:AIR synthase family protein [Tepidanaerobacter syntrophicus]GLI51042.1 hydrogenase [Tepidanaerobacter syntrophicus]